MAALAVADFFEALGETPADTLLTYLISTLEDNTVGTADLLELQDIITGFCPSFEALSDSQKHTLVAKLVRKVRQVCQYASLLEAKLRQLVALPQFFAILQASHSQLTREGQRTVQALRVAASTSAVSQQPLQYVMAAIWSQKYLKFFKLKQRSDASVGSIQKQKRHSKLARF